MIKSIFFVLSCVFLDANGHLNLKDILGGVHERVDQTAHSIHKHLHETTHNVADKLLGGLNLNFQGHIGINGHQEPPPPKPHGGQETIVVIVEENKDDGPNHNSHGNGYNNFNGHNQYSGNSNPYEQSSNFNGIPYGQVGGNSNYGQGQGNFGRPEQYPPNNNYGQVQGGNYEQDKNKFEKPQHNHNGQINQQETRPGGYQINQQGNNYNRPGNQNQEYPTTNQGIYGQYNTPTPTLEETKPTFGTVHENPTEKPSIPDKPGKDEPLLVPLNPNQYVYSGDKISINAPKRETEDKKPVDDADEDAPIDIRFQDE